MTNTETETLIPTPIEDATPRYLVATLTPEQATRATNGTHAKSHNVYLIHAVGQRRETWSLKAGKTPEAAIVDTYGAVGRPLIWKTESGTPKPTPTIDDLFALNNL